MAVSLWNLEYMITYCDGLALNAIHMVGVDDCRPVNTDKSSLLVVRSPADGEVELLPVEAEIDIALAEQLFLQ